MKPEITVSIYCLAYNHEKYIRKTLDGFLNQEANFEYEIIVHDDASTDGTAAIIQEYAKKHANIIAIYQTENQYSKKVNIIKNFIEPHVRGKYVAMCEGDDFWTDPHKLQKQVTALEAHKKSLFCVHKVTEIFENGEETGRIYPSGDWETKEYSSNDFLRLYKEGNFPHLSSYMMDAKKWKDYIKNPPEFATLSGVGDIPYILYFAQLGCCFYINESMSCYRKGVPTGWCGTVQTNKTLAVQYSKGMLEVYLSYDIYTGYKYHDICSCFSTNTLFFVAVLTYTPGALFQEGHMKSLSLIKKLYALFSLAFPHLAGDIYWKRHIRQMKKLGYHGQ